MPFSRTDMFPLPLNDFSTFSRLTVTLCLTTNEIPCLSRTLNHLLSMSAGTRVNHIMHTRLLDDRRQENCRDVNDLKLSRQGSGLRPVSPSSTQSRLLSSRTSCVGKGL